MAEPRTPQVGDTAPDFTLLDSTGMPQRLSSMTAKRGLVLIFYRGYWCAFCLRQLAEFRQHYEGFRNLNLDVAAISVDEPGNAEPMRHLYQLPFVVLCDTRAEVVQEWNVFNAQEKGGIAKAAVFVLDPGMKVRFSSVDSTASRVHPSDLIEYLQASAAGAEAPRLPERRAVVPTMGEIAKTLIPTIKLSISPPKRGA